MRGSVAKKLRRLVMKQEIRVSERAFQEFKLWVRTRPLHQRAVIAWKILWRSL